MSGVLLLTVLRYPDIQGGVDTMVMNLVAHLRQHHKVCVFVPGEWSQRALSEHVLDGIPVFSLRLRLPIDSNHPLIGFGRWLVEFPITVMRLRGLMRERGIDLIHAQMGKEHYLYLRVLRWFGGPPYIITLHGSDVTLFSRLPAATQALVRFTLAGAAKVVAVSNWLAHQAEETFPEAAPITRIYNGIDLPTPALLRDEMAVHLNGPLPQRFAVMVGSFDYYKGHDAAIRAWSCIKKQAPDLHLVIAGDGDLRAHYESLISEADCVDRVHLLGQIPRDDVLRLMSRALLMIFPSHNEGLGYVLLEAGSVGLPVICTRIPVFMEIVEDRVNGMLVPVDDSTAIAEAVITLAGDRALRERLGRTLENRIRAHFAAEVMARSYDSLYQSVIACDN